jgi:hypothetical protein
VDPRDPEVARGLRSSGYLVLYEGKTFRQYDDRWSNPPRYLVSLENLKDKSIVLERARFYRLGYRDIAGPGDQNVSIFNLHPPGMTSGHTAPLEHFPGNRSNVSALAVLAELNSFSFDWLLQLRVRSHVNQFMLLSTSFGWRSESVPLLSHAALRLTCNHCGYAPLWREQLGEVWREPGKPPLTWPALATDHERWQVRVAIDAVVADAYGLNRDQYTHVLSTFKHTSYPKAPELCLARFDELKAIGLDAFAKKHDPYWDIPLNENLPRPVIELSIPDGESAPVQGEKFELSDQPKRTRRRASRK